MNVKETEDKDVNRIGVAWGQYYLSVDKLSRSVQEGNWFITVLYCDPLSRNRSVNNIKISLNVSGL